VSYIRANTGNPLGWRGNTVTLGNMVRHNGPDWKDVAAHHDAMIRAGRQRNAARQRDAQYRMQMVDAAARGDRTRVRVPSLSGLGGLDVSSQMVPGQTYVFHFTCSIGFGIGCPSLDAVRNAILTDSNFANPTPLLDGNGGMAISFQYNGQGSNILQAAGEMASVIQSNVSGYARFVFVSADGPGGTLTAPGNPDNNNNPSTFNWSSFLAGMGLSVGVGTALAVGLGVLLLKD